MVNQYDEMQGNALDVSEMEAHNIPTATDPRWAFTHGMEGMPMNRVPKEQHK